MKKIVVLIILLSASTVSAGQLDISCTSNSPPREIQKFKLFIKNMAPDGVYIDNVNCKKVDALVTGRASSHGRVSNLLRSIEMSGIRAKVKSIDTSFTQNGDRQTSFQLSLKFPDAKNEELVASQSNLDERKQSFSMDETDKSKSLERKEIHKDSAKVDNTLTVDKSFKLKILDEAGIWIAKMMSTVNILLIIGMFIVGIVIILVVKSKPKSAASINHISSKQDYSESAQLTGRSEEKAIHKSTTKPTSQIKSPSNAVTPEGHALVSRKVGEPRIPVKTSTITKVSIFVEIPGVVNPAYLKEVKVEVPSGFIEFADSELKLNGNLCSYINTNSSGYQFEKYQPFNDAERQALFITKATAGEWVTCYRTEGQLVFSILVEMSNRNEATQTQSQSVTEKNNINTQKELINQLWADAKELSWPEPEKAIELYTELLTLLDGQSTTINIGAIFHNRAMAYRLLEDYDLALNDLDKEMEVAQSSGDYMSEMACRRITEEVREEQKKTTIRSGGGEKASRMGAMEEQANSLISGLPEFEGAFEAIFNELDNSDSDFRAEASRLLSEHSNALQALVSIYQDCLDADPRRASLAGRVLGRKAAKGLGDEMIDAQNAELMFGLSISFINCGCLHCNHQNKGIPAPPNGMRVPYYQQSDDDNGAYSIPVLCDKCGKEYFVVWDEDPRVC